MSQIKAVIFDMDGLMFDTETVYYKANQLTADTLGLEFSFDIYREFIGAGDDIYHGAIRELYKDPQMADNFLKQSSEKVDELLLEGSVEKKEGLIALLDYLKEEQIECIVASSSRRWLVDQLLEQLNVRPYFKDVVGGDEVPTAKPDPAIFNKAFSKTTLADKEEALILEDSKNGVLAAHAADIPVVLVPDLVEPDDEMQEKTAAVLENLHQAIEWIEAKNK